MADLATLRTAVQRWVERAEADGRVKACWLEGATPAAIRTFDGPLDLHVGVEDPDFEPFIEELEAFLGAGAAVRQYADGPAQPDAWATVADLEGVGAVTCTLERMSLLGKRPRAAVQPMFDRTGNLRHVLDYSGARPAPAPDAPAGGRPMPRHPELLDAAAIASGLGALPDWHRDGDEILASFQMPSFLSAVKLVGEVALAAEAANHHPNMLIRYRTVSFSCSTHEAGGVTQRDLDLAGTIATLAEAIRSGRRAKSTAKKKAKKKAKKPVAKKKAATKAVKKKPAAKAKRK